MSLRKSTKPSGPLNLLSWYEKNAKNPSLTHSEQMQQATKALRLRGALKEVDERGKKVAKAQAAAVQAEKKATAAEYLRGRASELMSNLASRFGTQEQRDRWLQKINDGIDIEELETREDIDASVTQFRLATGASGSGAPDPTETPEAIAGSVEAALTNRGVEANWSGLPAAVEDAQRSGDVKGAVARALKRHGDETEVQEGEDDAAQDKKDDLQKVVDQIAKLVDDSAKAVQTDKRRYGGTTSDDDITLEYLPRLRGMLSEELVRKLIPLKATLPDGVNRAIREWIIDHASPWSDGED